MSGIPSSVPGAENGLVQEIQLIISAKNLKDKDVLSKSDPMCVVWTASGNDWVEHGRTEVVPNSLNPNFGTRINIHYRFEELQKLKFSIHDVDKPGLPLEKQDFLGEAACTLGQIVSAGRLTLQLAPPHRGQISIEYQDMTNNKEQLELLFSAQQLPKSTLLSEPDPFLEIYRISSSGQTLVHRTVHVNNTRRPSWSKISLPLYSFLKDGAAADISIQCLNHNGNGKHKLIGQVQMNGSSLFEGPKTFELKNPSKGAKCGGQLILHEARRRRIYSFTDYVHSGNTELHCTFAVDFTGSNGSPDKANSLHYLYGNEPTKYEVALRSVGRIIQDYDKDKQFPVLGFGARVPPNFQLSHEFFVNMSPSPFCSGIDGVVDAYRRCLPLVQLYGPTCFAPVIRHVTNFAASYANGGHYFILLILTDGIINDMEQTKQALIDASALPISVIIVGIGDADFDGMKELDGDGGLLTVGGRRAQRDIVQFVPFRDFLRLHDPYKAGEELARALLAEVPQQLVSFMSSRNVIPRQY